MGSVTTESVDRITTGIASISMEQCSMLLRGSASLFMAWHGAGAEGG